MQRPGGPIDTYTLELDEAVSETVDRVRAWLSSQPKPPWLDLDDAIVWFAEASERDRFAVGLRRGESPDRSGLARLDWRGGTLQLVTTGEEVTDAVQQELVRALQKAHTLRLVDAEGNGVAVDSILAS